MVPGLVKESTGVGDGSLLGRGKSINKSTNVGRNLIGMKADFTGVEVR